MGEPAYAPLTTTLLEGVVEKPVTVAVGRRISGDTTGEDRAVVQDPKLTVLPCDSAEVLVAALKQGRTQAAVRGDLPAREVKRELERAFGLDPQKGLDRAVLVELAGGLRLVGPVGIDEGHSFEDRLRLAEKAAAMMERLGRSPGGGVEAAVKESMNRPSMTHKASTTTTTTTTSTIAPKAGQARTPGALAKIALEIQPDPHWKPRLAILSLGRPEDRDRSEQVRRSLEQGEALASALAKKNHAARHYGIEIERAAREADILITPDGTHGNLIFRTLHFLGGVKAWGAPVLALWPEVVFVDSSRARSSFEGPVRLAARLAAVLE